MMPRLPLNPLPLDPVSVFKMTPEQFVMWCCAVLMGFVLWEVNTKIGTMQDEHFKLLGGIQVQCYNTADLVQDKDLRMRHQRRCLDMHLNIEHE